MNDEMNEQTISNLMLYELMRDMKEDLRELKTAVNRNTEKINELYLTKDSVKVTFSKTFVFANAALSAFVAFFVALFTKN